MAASGGSSYYIPFESRIAIASLSGNGGLNLEADFSRYATVFTIGDASAYSGRLTVNSYRNSRDNSIRLGVLSVASLELGEGCTLTGGVFLKSDNLLENATVNGFKLEDTERRSMLGVQGTVTIGGLSDEGRTYLYAGTLDTSIPGNKMTGYQGTDGTSHVFDYEAERNNIQAALASPAQEATLIIDNTGNDTYAGTVLGKDRGGTATLNLMKRGTGTQSFTGDMSQWGGDISVEEGTLAFGSGLSARHIALSSNATLNAEGNTLALLKGGGFSTIGVARTDLSALQAQATVGTGDVLSFSSEATHINAHLDLSQGGSLSMGATLDLHGNTLTMSMGNPLAFSLDWNFLASIKEGDTFDLLLFTNVGNWAITGSEEGAAAVSEGLVSYNASQFLQSACLTDQSQLIYDGSSIILTSAVGLPEPATATLSLLALSLLAARRRRG